MIRRSINALFHWFETRVSSFPPELPEKPPETFIDFIKHYSYPFRWLILAASIIGILQAILEVLLFAFLGQLVDWLTTTSKETLWTDHGMWLSVMALTLVIGLPLLRFAYECITHQGILGNFAMRTRWQAHRYVLRQSVGFFHDDLAGRVATKVMQTSLGIRDLVFRLLEAFLFVSVYFVTAVILFAYSDLRLTAPMIIWVICYGVLLFYFVPKLSKISMEQANHRSVVTGQIVDSYSNITTIKMFSHAAREDGHIQNSMSAFLENIYVQMRLSNLFINGLYLLSNLLIFATAVLAIWLWTQDAISIGEIAFAIGLVFRIQGFSEWILNEVWSIFENVGIIKDGLGTIAKERKVLDKENANKLPISIGKINYSNISFNYGKFQKDNQVAVIDNLSLSIAPGEKVGIVGRSGAGKSTLVNVLLRFHDLDSGKITIDDHDIADVTQESLRAQIGVVTQDTALLHRSVLDNIRYGKPQATINDVIDVAKQAEAHDFIADLTDHEGRSGYHALVGERGVKLSGGQRQRIAIARALLKDAPILVLDEATSALDSEVEAAIQKSLNHLMTGKTVVAIAHRLSTIAAMDRLIVMEKGAIIEQGSHDELIEQDGLYAQLWQRQSGGFLLAEHSMTEEEV